MERKKRLLSCTLLILGVAVMIPHTTKGYEKEQQENCFETQSGIPDAVSGTTSNTTHHLTVIANSDRIEDKEEFARTVIHMCQDNSFHTIKFSTDHGYPSELDIDVFLGRKDVEERKEPVCKIKFATDDFTKGYDIKENPDKFKLYLDGKEIEFY